MPVVKGGVWTNIEDEILKASVSKYGLNQWARVSSLLARKTPKQCKARWTEWLDPGIRKIEWSKEEDEKLLHLAKLMPTQWRTIAPIVGRTATQCLERYQKLLDEAEARENDELGLGGPEGGETAAPTGDQVRKLRPGELDPDPESKPARPDTIDLDEDEKEMLSEARARLANTQGKKAKRKARERQLEESRRLAVLQKRRELKNSGINIKITTRKKGEMDYNADIPFEKQAAPGFHDTLDEEARNDREREMFDPRKQQLARKRQGDAEDSVDAKRQKQDKGKDSAAMAAAARAGQMQRLREAEQQSKRRALNLPAPQVSEGELEEIVKMGVAGHRAVKAAGQEDGDDRGLISQYSNMVGATPIRTPRAPAQEDHIANEIRNIRALTETQSSLLGGENTPLHEGSSSTGFDGIAPRRNEMVTPNPMATPLRQAGTGGQFPGATPLRTPRDNLIINERGERQLVPQTPRDMRLAENVARHSLRAKLASLPKPKESEWELEVLPSEHEEAAAGAAPTQEDQEEIDRREREAREAAEEAEFKRQTQVYQRALPRPVNIDYNSLASDATSITDPIRAMIAQEAALLMAHDARRFPLPGSKVVGKPPELDSLPDDLLAQARQQLKQACNETERQSYVESVYSFTSSEAEPNALPLKFHSGTTPAEYLSAFRTAHQNLLSSAAAGQKLEDKLKLHLGGYQARQKSLKQKIASAYAQIEEQRAQLDSFKTLQINEEGALARRLERLRDEVTFVMRREREAQEDYRAVRDEARALEERANGEWCENHETNRAGVTCTQTTRTWKYAFLTTESREGGGVTVPSPLPLLIPRRYRLAGYGMWTIATARTLRTGTSRLGNTRVNVKLNSVRFGSRFLNMKALVYQGNEKYGLEDRPVPKIKDASDAIVKVVYTTICGTDTHILHGDVPTCKPGTILGHEGVGVVEEPGPGVARFKKGDRVLINCISSCATCNYCRRGMPSHCVSAGWILGNTIDGTQAEYVRIPFADSGLHHVPKGVDEKALVMLSDIFPTGLECGVQNGKVQPGSTVAIVGSGPVGLAAMMTAKLYSPSLVIMIDRDPSRLKVAKKLGADHTVNSAETDPLEFVMKLTDNVGCDTVMEAVGVPETLEMAQDLVAPGGTVANVGVHGKSCVLKVEKLWAQNISLTTRLVDTVTTPMLLKLFASGGIQPGQLITHEFSFTDMAQAYTTFKAAAQHDALKMLIKV